MLCTALINLLLMRVISINFCLDTKNRFIVNKQLICFNFKDTKFSERTSVWATEKQSLSISYIKLCVPFPLALSVLLIF